MIEGLSLATALDMRTSLPSSTIPKNVIFSGPGGVLCRRPRSGEGVVMFGEHKNISYGEVQGPNMFVMDSSGVEVPMFLCDDKGQFITVDIGSEKTNIYRYYSWKDLKPATNDLTTL